MMPPLSTRIVRNIKDFGAGQHHRGAGAVLGGQPAGRRDRQAVPDLHDADDLLLPGHRRRSRARSTVSIVRVAARGASLGLRMFYWPAFFDAFPGPAAGTAGDHRTDRAGDAVRAGRRAGAGAGAALCAASVGTHRHRMGRVLARDAAAAATLLAVLRDAVRDRYSAAGVRDGGVRPDLQRVRLPVGEFPRRHRVDPARANGMPAWRSACPRRRRSSAS